MWDYLIKNGFVVDGAGGPWYRGDVATAEGKISDMNSRLPASKADVIIDAKGLVVCPGFIDVHSHSELAFIAYPNADSMVHQGVTTQFTCQCGISGTGPLKGEALEQIKRSAKKEFGLNVDWRSLTQYIERFKGQGCAINGAFQVGHGTVRLCVMGWENRAPTKNELDEMKSLVAQTMEEGAFGLSTGLMYTPGAYAETDEVIELAKVVGKYGGIHTSHDRRRGWENEPRGGRDFIVPIMDSDAWSLRECIKIGESAGIPTTWTHAKAAGRVNLGKASEFLKEVEFARRRGVDVGVDVYPWTFGGSLIRGFPTWAEEGGPEKMRERLRDPETRKKIRDIMKVNTEGVMAERTWDRALILSTSEEDKDLIGKFMNEAAKIREMEPVDLYLDRLEKGRPILGVAQHTDEGDVRTFLKHPLTMVSTDGTATPTNYSRKVHPRNFGNYPKILGQYVREERILTLEEAIRKMTSAGAAKLGLMDRGLVRPDFWADITIFDPLNVRELATYSDPMRHPQGIEYVFVNGILTVKQGQHTLALAGKPLKHRSAED